MNIDAAIRVSNQTAGLGMVIRDFRSKVVAAAVQKVPYKGIVACMEAEAVNLGIQVAQNSKFLPMIIDSDSKEVVDLSQNKKGTNSEIFWTITSIRVSLRSLNSSIIHFVPRHCNSTAHALAQKAFDFDSLSVWLGTFPAEVRLLLSDFL